MTPDQIYAERSSGKTLSDIAKEKDVTDQQLVDAMLAGRQDGINQAVQDGKITQAQADWTIARVKAMAPFEITNPFTPGASRGPMGGGRGPMRGGHCPCGQAAPSASGPSDS